MKPLLGVKVIDLSTLLPGPLTSTYLELLGANVIKIEPPGGDPARNFPELFNALKTKYAKDVTESEIELKDQIATLDIVENELTEAKKRLSKMNEKYINAGFGL